MPIPITENHPVAHTQVKPFLVALRSPFSIARHTAFHHPTALCRGIYIAYSLFFNGLKYYSAEENTCQALFFYKHARVTPKEMNRIKANAR